jgi:peptidoglycan/xylan/chitin deacetylase (PgdA/CDA1 family)
MVVSGTKSDRIMRMLGLKRLRRTAQWMRNKFVQGAVILLYHRVSELPTDPQLMCVTPRHFAEQLEILRKEYNPIELRELTKGFQDGNVPHRSVAITFDDGYFDNLANAKPILERFDIPATVFVASGYIGCQREFWSDELERLLLQPGTLPRRLALTIEGRQHEWNLAAAASYSEEAYQRYRTWNVRERAISGSRQDLYNAIHPLIRPLAHAEQQVVLDSLLAWAGMKPVLRSTHRTVSTDEVLCMAKGTLIDIGAHTITHPVLSALSLFEEEAEIQGSKAHLEEILGRPVTSFAYPYGLRSDYSPGTITAVKQAGFDSASSSEEGNVWRGSDRFQLPRRIVFDWDGEQFSRRLRHWLGG